MRRLGILTGTLVCAVVAVLAQLPLIGNRIFYYWDDSAAQFLPMWYHLGQLVAGGHWPTLLDLHTWMGGNVAGEALFGVYNPLNVANFLLVFGIGDLAVAAAVVKTEFLIMLALGTYLVCREYEAKRHVSAAVAIALPFSGFTLYFDTAAWASGLISFAYLPFVWWSVRKAARGALNPFWAFLIGAGAITSGNPYGVLGVCVVLLGLLVEFGVRKRWRGFRTTLLLGVCVGLVVPLVFLPLALTGPVTWRAGWGILNDGFLVPSGTDLMAMSVPGYLPRITAFDGAESLRVPAAYFAWFALPLAPWLNYRAARRATLGAVVVAAVFLALTLGPSSFWMFRWPLRLIEYFYLGLGVLLAVVLSAGLRTDHRRIRIVLTAGILLGGAYLAWATEPKTLSWNLLGLVVVAAFTAAAIWVSRRGTAFGAVLITGTAAVLGLQLANFPGNFNIKPYYYPHSVQALKDTFADRYQGETLQIASIKTASDTIGLGPDKAWRYFLFGYSYQVAGVDAVNSYAGMGFSAFSETLCFDGFGSSCAEAYPNLWRPTSFGGAPLADLIRLRTVVVENALVPELTVPDGWQVVEHDEVVTVLRRTGPLPWPQGTLAWAGPGLSVSDDASEDSQAETVRFTANGPDSRQLVFARLAWPGYEARVNGQEVPVSLGPSGLLTVELPPGTTSGELTLSWAPPAFWPGIWLAVAGLLGGLALGVGHYLTRRKHGTENVVSRGSGTVPRPRGDLLPEFDGDSPTTRIHPL
ncbi:hypothetical protein [Amycolatopsis taiwanensis]|uniref:hypothetical protein n=1 Tax=Amycolatopsis taiwanensis TaxID=342230 RepID=UPI0012EB0BFA|nr:hypothetical protein [Amycolatopsis taiwanensis]